MDRRRPCPRETGLHYDPPVVSDSGSDRRLHLIVIGVMLAACAVAGGVMLWPQDSAAPPAPGTTPVAGGQGVPPQSRTDQDTRGPAKADLSSIAVKVTAEAPSCKRTLETSGFAYAPERVMTVAHGVAGSTGAVRVTGPDGKRHDATVVLFDPKRDVAVLRVPTLRLPATGFSPLRSGERATVVGYSRTGGFTESPTTAVTLQRVAGPDIFLRGKVSRQVLILKGAIDAGVSGGPIRRADGVVAGMVFAADARDDRQSLALPPAELAQPMQAGITATSGVSTQRCSG